MSTITQICAAIETILAELPAIDESSLNSYLPPVKTQKVALVIPPMGMRGSVGAPVGRKTRLIHRIPCEFWVKVNTGNQATAITHAREISLDAAAALQATQTPTKALNDTVSYLGDGSDNPPFEWAIENQVLQVGDIPYIRATLIVTVTEWVTLRP